MSDSMGAEERTMFEPDQSDWDADQLVEQISADLGEAAPNLSTVRQTVNALFAKYNHARVKTFVPVLVRRRAIELLKQPQPGQQRE